MRSTTKSTRHVASDNDPGIRVLTTNGVRFLTGLSERERSIVGTHWNDVRRLLEDGNEVPLAGLHFAMTADGGTPTVGGYQLEFDPDVIEHLAARDGIKFESIYEG